MWFLRGLLFVFVILTVDVTCVCESLRPYPHPYPRPRPPTTQPMKHTLDRPPLAVPFRSLQRRSLHALAQTNRVTKRVWEEEKEEERPTHSHANTYDYSHTHAKSVRRPKNSRAGRPPLGEGPWSVPRSPPPLPAPPRPPSTTPPSALSQGTLRKLNLFYLGGFLRVTERGARAGGEACVGEGGRSGVCLLERECIRGGGTLSIPCNDGYFDYATCCIALVRGCGVQAVKNRTYWIASAQSSGGTTCRLRVPKLSREICYIRLDLLKFKLALPRDGRCDRDHLKVTGQNINAMVPALCGTNTGQHLYVGVGRVPGPLELAVTTVGEEAERRWEIKVTQVACGAEGAPPDGCLQYYTSPQGFFTSFNYLSTGASEYLNNLNYAVCLARAAAFCSVTYSAGDMTANNTFQMVNYSFRGGTLTPTVTAGEAGVGVVQCRGDYVVMAGTRLCGDRLNDGSLEPRATNNGPVTESTNGPFLVQVMTDSQYTGRGFNISYQQNPC